MSRVWSTFYLLAASWLITGCALGGTEAGNPTMSETAAGNVPLPGQFAQYLVDTICVKYTQCYPSATATQCGTGVLAQSNIPQGFGLGAGFGTAQQMVAAERAGTIHADYTHVVNCSAEIRTLSCASSPISSASPVGPATTTGAYSTVINMIPTSGTSCAGVF